MTDIITSLTRQLLKDKANVGKRTAELPQDIPSNFFIMCTGQVDSGEFDGIDNLYCRYTISHGNDWDIIHGLDSGLSQIARRNSGEDPKVVWNFPIDVTFKSTNAFGWPRISISIFGIDALGRDIIRGYGSVLIPTTAGQHERLVALYRPVASSPLQQFISWITGTLPEFFDSKFVSQSEGREVTRVETTGLVKVKLNVMTKGMAKFGYTSTEPLSVSSSQFSSSSNPLGSTEALSNGGVLFPGKTNTLSPIKRLNLNA